MSATGTGEYLAHHLRLAVRSDTPFSDDVVSIVDESSAQMAAVEIMGG